MSAFLLAIVLGIALLFLGAIIGGIVVLRITANMVGDTLRRAADAGAITEEEAYQIMDALEGS